MPVTAKLSRRFYETFGDEIANELVEWFNRVDDTYRSEFRELFEVHFSRFDAKLEQRIGELRAEMDVKLARLEAKLEQRLAEVRAGLMKWMFIFWAGNVAATLAIVATAVLLLRR
jgi:hypothetical protein